MRLATPILAWIVGVGCCMHARVDGILRLLGVTGVHLTQLPVDLWQRRRRPWLSSATGALLLLTIVGVLSALGVIGCFRIG